MGYPGTHLDTKNPKRQDFSLDVTMEQIQCQFECFLPVLAKNVSGTTEKMSGINYINIMHKVIYLYILKCSDGSLYVGVTNNPERRLIEHNLGINPDSYTYSRRPVEIVFHELFTDFNLAFEWEARIKKWSRAKKQALIDGDFTSLKELSKKKFKKQQEGPFGKSTEE